MRQLLQQVLRHWHHWRLIQQYKAAWKGKRVVVKKMHFILMIMMVVVLMSIAWWFHRSSIEAGERIATANCGSCHDLSAKKINEKGPYLWGIVNRRAAMIDGFSYSEAFRQFADARQFSWTEANLDVFITDPDQLIPGTRMAQQESDSNHAKAFEGMQNLDNRRELIVFLRTLN